MRRTLVVLVAVLASIIGGIGATANAPDDAGPSANGTFQFSVGDGVTRYVSFNARIHKDNAATGEMTYTDPTATVNTDPDNPSASSSPGISIKVEFDCLVIDGNRAVMSGSVVQASVGDAIGRRVLLVVEDDDQGSKATGRDKLAWGIYKPKQMNWIPADAELENDIGATLTWQATDFEQPNDVGYPSNRSTAITCQSFPISSYSFVDVQHGEGNIQVKP
jgi:hypothetical protein